MLVNLDNTLLSGRNTFWEISLFSLFSSFDSFIFEGSMVVVFISVSYFITPFWVSSQISSSLQIAYSFLTKFFLSLKPSGFTKMFSFFTLSLFFLLFLLNFSSVYPYNFANTSQPSTVLLFSGPLWMAIVSASAIYNMKGLFSHLVPEGSPMGLVPLLFVIEIVSNIIRPITLTVRLVANILAGHLLMILLASAVSSFSFFFPLYAILNLAELLVALIQSYIFATMITLYFSDL